MWTDIVSIVFVCVTANHLGLVRKLEEIMGELPIINCPKCLSFWCSLPCGLWYLGFSDLPLVLAVSFLASYSALWLELFEGYVDTLYTKIYTKIYTDYEKINAEYSDDKATTGANNGNTKGTMP